LFNQLDDITDRVGRVGDRNNIDTNGRTNNDINGKGNDNRVILMLVVIMMTLKIA
ncbi:24101_t:CDS:1, partial [Gigaspora margarita]